MSGYRPPRGIRARDVDCETCGAIPGTSCTVGPRATGDPWAPRYFYHATRVDLADQLEEDRRRREYPACACGSSRPHLSGPRCSPAWDASRVLLENHPHGGPPPAERGAPTAPTP